VASHANTGIDDAALISKGVRKKGSGSWLGKIWSGIKGVMGIAAPLVGAMGPYGKAAGMAMGLLGGQPSMTSDSYQGRINTSLNTG
jgi:hypothetical protein